MITCVVTNESQVQNYPACTKLPHNKGRLWWAKIFYIPSPTLSLIYAYLTVKTNIWQFIWNSYMKMYEIKGVDM